MPKKPKAKKKRRVGTSVRAATVSGSEQLVQEYIGALDRHGEALRANTDMLRSIAGSQDQHALAINSLVATVTASRVITRDVIKGVLAERWGIQNPNNIGENDAITNYIIGGPDVINSYWSVLNSLPRFAADHLSMTREDMQGVINVGRMISAVATGYRRLGWIVR